MLGLMEACNMDDHTLLAVFCRYLFLISFLVASSRCLVTLFLAEFDIVHVLDVLDIIQSIRLSRHMVRHHTVH